MRILKSVVVAALIAATAAAPAAAHADSGAVSVTPLESLTAQQVKDFVEPLGVYIPQATQAVDTYRINYSTVGADGRRTRASAFVALPQTADHPLRPALWLHGTQSFRDDAPSISPCCDRAAAILFASIGYATTAPDYLGLGEGPGTHPYFHSATMVSASIDALKATRMMAAERGKTVTGKVMVSGFSQGANAALLVARELQLHPVAGFPLGGVAPISGGYELFRTEWPAALSGQVRPDAATYYLAYITVAWNKLYHLYGNESEVFKQPNVAPLFDGTHQLEDIQKALPASPDLLLQDSWVQRLLHPTGMLRVAELINDNACRYWTPAVPVRMFAAHSDDEAVYANSVNCRRSFTGADVTLTDVGEANHIGSLIKSMPQVATWFATGLGTTA